MLQDKKRMIMIGGGLLVVVAVALVFLWPRGPATAPPSPTASAPAPGTPAAPAAPTPPLPVAVTPAPSPAVSTPSLDAALPAPTRRVGVDYRLDPFVIPGFRPPGTGLTVIPTSAVIAGLPAIDLSLPRQISGVFGPTPDGLASVQRVSGILYNDRVLALVETGGRTYVVQPGDTIDGKRVIAITPDGVTVSGVGGAQTTIPLVSRGLAGTT